MLKRGGFILLVLVALGVVFIPYYRDSYLLQALQKLRDIPSAPAKPSSKTLLITAQETKWEQPVDTVSTASLPLQAWLIQIGSFKDQANAEQLVQSLQAQGIPAYSRNVLAETKTLSKVYVGPYIQRHEADLILDKLQRLTQLEPRIMAYDPTYAKEE